MAKFFIMLNGYLNRQYMCSDVVVFVSFFKRPAIVLFFSNAPFLYTFSKAQILFLLFQLPSLLFFIFLIAVYI